MAEILLHGLSSLICFSVACCASCAVSSPLAKSAPAHLPKKQTQINTANGKSANLIHRRSSPLRMGRFSWRQSFSTRRWTNLCKWLQKRSRFREVDAQYSYSGDDCQWMLYNMYNNTVQYSILMYIDDYWCILNYVKLKIHCRMFRGQIQNS